MKNKKEVIAGLIIIGNEILSGRTQDTNTSTLSLWLNSIGVKVEEVRINCEQNSLLYLVTPKGQGACHTKDEAGKSRSSCYYRTVENNTQLRYS